MRRREVVVFDWLLLWDHIQIVPAVIQRALDLTTGDLFISDSHILNSNIRAQRLNLAGGIIEKTAQMTIGHRPAARMNQ